MKTLTLKANHNRERKKFIYRFEEKINNGSIEWIVSLNQIRIKSLHKSNLAVILYLTGLILLCESCAFTWIGCTVGADIGRPSFSDYSNSRIIKVSPENTNYGGRNYVEVHSKDSSVIRGIFRDFVILPGEQNNPDSKRFDDSFFGLQNFVLTGDSCFASIGDKPTYSQVSCYFECTFRDGIGIKTGKYNHTLAHTYEINFTNSEKTVFDLPEGIGLNYVNQPQDRNGVLIRLDKGQKIIIPIREIAYVRCQRGERNGKLIGAAAGVLIDAVLVIIKSRDEIAEITTTLDF
jgi:hypothetical protein